MKCMLFSFFIYVVFFAFPAQAEWSSGGGELIKDSQNPWFIQNTPEVTYCIVIDGSSVGISESQANSTIQQALAYWKEEFTFSGGFDPQVKVATQVFKKVSCDPERGIWADLAFQYGYLTQKQRDYLGGVRRFASVAVRTAYDRKSLKGRGFVYFAAETGPDALKDPRFVANHWSINKQALLYWTTIHELGHVFGLPHNAENPENLQIMSHRFVEHILRRDKASGFPRDLSPKQIFKIRPKEGDFTNIVCSDNYRSRYLQKAKEFFGVNQAWRCFGTKLTNAGLEIWASESARTIFTPTQIGTLKEVESFTLVTNAMIFWLPPEQTVFPHATRVNTPSYNVADISGKYISMDGITKRMLGMTIDPRKGDPLFDDLKISGELNERFYANLIEGY